MEKRLEVCYLMVLTFVSLNKLSGTKLTRQEITDNVNSYTLCFIPDPTISSYASSKFNVYDFAHATDNGYLTPMGINNVTIDNAGHICGNVQGPALTETIFPIVRKESWKNEKREYYSNSVRLLSAVLFCYRRLYYRFCHNLFS
jgi:hypothetical protein